MIETSSKLPLKQSRRFHSRSNSTLTRGPWAIRDADHREVMRITKIQVSPADEAHALRGLIAFLTIEIDGLLSVDGIALRFTRDARFTLSFPKRSSRSSKEQSIVRPINASARTAIERTILEALELNSEAMSCE